MIKTYCFDIDGVVCATKDSNYENSVPNEAVIERMRALYNKGNTIKLQTARGMGRTKDNVKNIPEAIKELTLSQMDEWDVPYDSIFFGKVSADIYIDDKGFCFDNPEDLDSLPGLKE